MPVIEFQGSSLKGSCSREAVLRFNRAQMPRRTNQKRAAEKRSGLVHLDLKNHVSPVQVRPSAQKQTRHNFDDWARTGRARGTRNHSSSVRTVEASAPRLSVLVLDEPIGAVHRDAHRAATTTH